ncbi:MAG: S49 family peptidase [Thaumarchaeota archaeon]|nr:S49 family peptidase [Candidatus Wolframiiraptor allenii]
MGVVFVMRAVAARLARHKLLLVIILCVLIGASGIFYLTYTLISPAVLRKNLVAILRIEGPILSPDVTSAYVDEIREALRNDSIKAVVLLIDSPGGEVTQVEHIYMELLELKKAKPLVASAIRALSGAYYIAVAADYIYTLPSSPIGNVGVIAQWSPAQPISEQALETGIYKTTGFSRLSFPIEIGRVLDNFVSAVKMGRGDRLKISDTELRRAKVYLGAEAVSLGLVDEIGSPEKAVEKAASMANLTEYEVVVLSKGAAAALQIVKERLNSTGPAWSTLDLEMLGKINPPPAIYYLYLPPEKLEYGTAQNRPGIGLEEKSSIGTGNRSVLIDMSHGNRVGGLELDVLIWELVKRNVTVEFIDSWRELGDKLRNSTALIIALPMISYSRDEVEDVRRFVQDGGILILIYDPASEYSKAPESVKVINSIANAFRISFASGYLYNEEHYYGIYRNIYVTEFSDNPLTRNVGSLVFFTATYIRSDGGGIAWPPDNTYSSQSERPGRYPVITFSKNNGTVIAVGDMTFLMEPYCYLEDNYKLITNLADYIASGGGS